MPYAIYKLIHLVGIFTIIVVLASTSMHVLRGGTRADNPYRRILGIMHGVALFLVLLGGFGLLSRIGVIHGGLPGWAYAKLVLWLLLGAALLLPYRGQAYARTLLILLPLLAAVGGAIALYKPF
jgi:hypothetical protein